MVKASIIIPSYNACERLYYNLLALNMQSCPREHFEVIIIDNGSTDSTWNMLCDFKAQFELKKLNTKQTVNRSAARNFGINSAEGEILIFSDSDMISEKDFVQKHILAHDKPDTVVSGTNWKRIYTYYYKNFKGAQERSFAAQMGNSRQGKPLKSYKDKERLISAQQILDGSYRNHSFINSIYDNGYQNLLQRFGSDLKGYHFPWSFFVTNNCSVSKDNIRKAGMFDEAFAGWGCEDLDLGYRLYKNGCSYIKADIESIHQEHPARTAEDGMSNIHRFSEKYQEVDVLLFYFHDLIPADAYKANEIMKEINSLKGSPKYKPMLDVFQTLLKAARDMCCLSEHDKYSRIKKQKQIRKDLKLYREELAHFCTTIKAEHNCSNFSDAFISLIKKNTS